MPEGEAGVGSGTPEAVLMQERLDRLGLILAIARRERCGVDGVVRPAAGPESLTHEVIGWLLSSDG